MAGKDTLAIVNPSSGGHSTYKDWPSISRYLNNKGLSCDHVFTEHRGHATQLALRAIKENYRCLIAVGGDGTVNEVVNGILDSNNPRKVTLGIISTGTTCSLTRSLGISLNPIESCNSLIRGNIISIDVGIVEYYVAGQRIRRFFANEADVGFGATVVEASKRITNYYGRKINYLQHVIGGLSSLLSYKNKSINIRVEDSSEDIYDCAMVVIANGTHFGGGMQIAPYAQPNDGLLDMVIFGDMDKSELFKVWTMTYKGRHVSHQKVKLLKIKNASIQCNEKILVEADGELLGEGPVNFSLVPCALDVFV